MMCICQEDGQSKDYFATYFDNDEGIAAYSAYTIEHPDAKLIGTVERQDWQQTPGWWRLIHAIYSYNDFNQNYRLNVAMVTYAVNAIVHVRYTQY